MAETDGAPPRLPVGASTLDKLRKRRRAAEPAVSRRRRIIERASTMLVAVLGAFLALFVAGDVEAPIGPFDTTLSAKPSFESGTRVELAPLGSLDMDTHRGPLGLTMRVDELRVDEARQIVDNPDDIDGLEEELADDTRAAIVALVLRVGLAMVVGAVLLSVLRRPRMATAVTGLATGIVLVAVVATTTVVTWQPRALAEPRYSGLLSLAPQAVGDARDVADRFTRYRSQLTGLVQNVATLYEAAEGLQTFEPDESTVRVLHVSDLHLNPEAFDLIEQLVDQFAIDVVVDTGDINDWGTPVESRFVDRIGDLDVPYVYVRGNHDSRLTQSAVADQPNAVVLDGEMATVAGITFWGVGDPRFTPDKSEFASVDEQREKAEEFAGEVADMVRDDADEIDVAVVHDPRMAEELEDLMPLALAGHSHEVDAETLGSTLLLTEGSTGGAGFRALQGEEPEPLTASVLYLDSDTQLLQAYDRITVGGLGTGAASIERHIVPVEDDEDEDADEEEEDADGKDDEEVSDEPGDGATEDGAAEDGAVDTSDPDATEDGPADPNDPSTSGSTPGEAGPGAGGSPPTTSGG